MPRRELLLGPGIAIVVFACAPSAPSMKRGPEAAQLDPVVAANIRDISTRMGEIRKGRSDMGLRIEPPPQLVVEASRRHGSLKLVCQDNEPEAQQCDDTCGLAQDICDNAKEICRIAGDLRGNSWAIEQCSSANASCTEASKQCCDCNDKHANDADASGTW